MGMGLESYREREGKRGGPPPAPLVDLGDHDLHARVPMVKLVQVLLHHVQQLNTGHIPQVIAAATLHGYDMEESSSSGTSSPYFCGDTCQIQGGGKEEVDDSFDGSDLIVVMVEGRDTGEEEAEKEL
ncbi:hypothetical protein NQZ68_026426, partial [Dissostichus eleginoides]